MHVSAVVGCRGCLTKRLREEGEMRKCGNTVPIGPIFDRTWEGRNPAFTLFPTSSRSLMEEKERVVS